MSPEQLLAQLKEIEGADTEAAHCMADDLLIKTLRALGYGAACDQFEYMDKWYA